jgi:hypothetical protein
MLNQAAYGLFTLLQMAALSTGPDAIDSVAIPVALARHAGYGYSADHWWRRVAIWASPERERRGPPA